MIPVIGEQLSHYRILERIGQGGMGVVYKAEDTRLGRVVAIKILPLEAMEKPEAAARLSREARAASAVNHPNLATIYEIDNSHGRDFIVMEYVEGETLAQRIGGRPLEVREVVEIGLQVAQALEKAHGKGMVHRDVKASNIMVKPDGQVKLMDFGLARLKDEGRITGTGSIVGTLAYAAPEQVMGQEGDARTDLYALGVVLYEALTGQLPHQGMHQAGVIYSIVNVEPVPPRQRNPQVPEALERIVMKLMAKRSGERYQSATEVIEALRSVAPAIGSGSGTEPFGPSRPEGARRPWTSWAIPVLLIALVIAIGSDLFLLLRRSTSRGGPGSFRHRQVTFSDGVELFPALSPDGKSIAYYSLNDGRHDVFVQDIEGGEPMNLTKGFFQEDWWAAHMRPSWSPSGTEILLGTYRGVFAISRFGGPIRKISNAPSLYPVWSPDGTQIAFRTEDGRLWLTAVGGEPKALFTDSTLVADFKESHFSWSPNGRFLAFTGGRGEYPDIYTMDLRRSLARRIVQADSLTRLRWPCWSSDGKYVYYLRSGANSGVWRIPISQTTGEVSGQPELVFPSAAIEMGEGGLSHSADGKRLAYTRRYLDARLWSIPVGATGIEPYRRSNILAPRITHVYHPAISPDGQWVTFERERYEDGYFNLWIMRLDGSQPQQLTSLQGLNYYPVWSPDGKRIAFVQDRNRKLTLRVLDVNTGKVVSIPGSVAYPLGNLTWTPDGSAIVVWDTYRPVLWAIPVAGGSRYPVFEGSPGDILLYPTTCYATGAIAFRWRHGGGEHIYVLPRGSRRAQRVTLEQYQYFRWMQWSADGRQIYFGEADPKKEGVRIRKVPVTGGKAMEVAWLGDVPNRYFYGWSISPDGKRLIWSAAPTFTSHVWVAELEKK